MSDESDKTIRTWARVLRPLAWWFLLVLVLYGIRLHQRWMAKTYLSFQVTVDGKPNPYAGERVQLDGKDYRSHELVSLGKHQLTVTNPKTESFTTNLFVWYGAHDLGEISLNRSKSLLHIKCDPPAPRLSIQGPEFSTLLTDATDFSETVPTDTYRVSATYAHWEERADVIVLANTPATREINPQFGALEISCNKSGATFELLRDVNRNAIQSGSLPVVITGLPAGYYRLNTSYRGHDKSEAVTVKFGGTNQVKSEFAFGTATLDTKPPNASVNDRDGRYLGQTPLTLSDLQPGTWTFQLKLPGYEPVTTTMEIAAKETQSFRTNLISLGYSDAMRSARGYMKQSDYDRAVSALTDALRAKPNDAAAIDLQREASGLGSIQRAKTLAYAGNYTAAGAALEEALKALPGNTEAVRLQAEYKTQALEQRERLQQERLVRGKNLFDSFAAKHNGADLFESYEIKTTKPFKDIEQAIRNALQNEPPSFVVRTPIASEPETFILQASLNFKNVITTTGQRICVIVGGQTKDDETKIYFKVLEYTAKHDVTMPGILAFKDSVSFVPIHPSRIPDMDDKLKAQVADGVSSVTARLQAAIGQ